MELLSASSGGNAREADTALPSAAISGRLRPIIEQPVKSFCEQTAEEDTPFSPLTQDMIGYRCSLSRTPSLLNRRRQGAIPGKPTCKFGTEYLGSEQNRIFPLWEH